VPWAACPPLCSRGGLAHHCAAWPLTFDPLPWSDFQRLYQFLAVCATHWSAPDHALLPGPCNRRGGQFLARIRAAQLRIMRIDSSAATWAVARDRPPKIPVPATNAYTDRTVPGDDEQPPANQRTEPAKRWPHPRPPRRQNPPTDAHNPEIRHSVSQNIRPRLSGCTTAKIPQQMLSNPEIRPSVDQHIRPHAPRLQKRRASPPANLR
jgi:hypothetical protein